MAQSLKKVCAIGLFFGLYCCLVNAEDSVDVRFSSDDGKTWSAPYRVVDFEGDGGYPSSIQLAGERVLTAYYARKIAGHDNYHMGVVIWDPSLTPCQ